MLLRRSGFRQQVSAGVRRQSPNSQLSDRRHPTGKFRRGELFIKRIQISKYRHLEDIELLLISRAPSETSELVVLAGPNGGGKTSVLELISQALSNMWSLTFQLNRTAPTSSFEVTIGLTPSELELISKAKGRDI